MSYKPNITIKAASWHRNGISGQGFYAILFDDSEHGPMVASLFDDPTYCAVYSIAELNKGNVEFANGNSWRGDVYADAINEKLQAFLSAAGSNRAGPFSIPIGKAEFS